MFLTARSKLIASAMHDYGYDFVAGKLISKGIKGFTSDRVMGPFRDVYDAAEFLIPIIQNRAFTDRVTQA